MSARTSLLSARCFTRWWRESGLSRGRVKSHWPLPFWSVIPAPISAVKPQTPSAFEHVVTTCLQKNPEERYQTAHDIKLELQWIADAPPTATQAPVVEPARRPWLPWAVAGVLAIAMIAFALAYFQSPRASQVSVHSYVLPPEKTVFLLGGNDAGPPVLSPDGLRIAFVAKNADSKQILLWIRPLNSAVAQPMAGTEGATFPFWSADSRYVAFFAAGKLNKLDASGGPPQAICDALSGRGGTWNSAGTIIFAAGYHLGPFARGCRWGHARRPDHASAGREGEFSSLARFSSRRQPLPQLRPRLDESGQRHLPGCARFERAQTAAAQ
jgi:hypothetical protein